MKKNVFIWQVKESEALLRALYRKINIVALEQMR